MLLALAIFIAVAFTMLGVLRALSRATQTVATATSGSLTLEAQIDAFRSEAATAFAVFVPDRDVFSGGNADGHEVDSTRRATTESRSFSRTSTTRRPRR